MIAADIAPNSTLSLATERPGNTLDAPVRAAGTSHEEGKATRRPVKRNRFITLSEPLVRGEEKATRATVHINNDDSAPIGVERGIYLSLRGTFVGVAGQFTLINGSGKEVAFFSPIPLRDWESGVPRAAEWVRMQDVASEILREYDPTDTAAVDYMGWLPCEGLSAERTQRINPLAPPAVEFTDMRRLQSDTGPRVFVALEQSMSSPTAADLFVGGDSFESGYAMNGTEKVGLKLTSPDAIRSLGEALIDLADRIESNGMAAAMRGQR